MSDNFDSVLKELKEALYNQECVKEYIAIKKQVDSSKALKELKAKLIELQKAMTKNLTDDELYFKYKEEYEKTLNIYNNHPLVNNYRILKEEVYSLLDEIKRIIE